MVRNEWSDSLRSDGADIVETGSEFAEAPSSISMGYLGKLRTIATLAAYLRDNQALVSRHDVVNLHNWPSYVAAWTARLLRRGRPPIVWTCNEPTEFWFSKNPVLRYHLHLIEKRAIKQLPAIVVLSTYMQKHLMAKYGAESTIIAPGVDPPGDAKETLQDRPAKKQRLDIVCYTRMAFFPVQVLESLLPREPGAVLHLFGSRAMHAYRYAIRRGLQASVQVHGWMPESDMVDFIASMDVMIFPHLAPFGLASVEALAVGVPVVSIAAGGQLDIIKDGFNGYTVASANPETFANAISSHLSTILSREMRLRCAVDAAQRFSWDRAADQYLRLFEDVEHRGVNPDW